jgi:hypothetical protein
MILFAEAMEDRWRMEDGKEGGIESRRTRDDF